MPSSKEYWSVQHEVDGPAYSLHEYGWSVATVGGTRYGVPPLRGENVQFAYVPGREFRPKIPDSRVITLVMWTQGMNSTAGAGCNDPRTQWNDNWQFLRKLFWTPDREFFLTRRWFLTDPDTGLPELHTATARGQYVSGLEPSMTGRFRADFTVDIALSDPFFYGPEEVHRVNLGEEVLIVNPGDYPAAHRNFHIELHPTMTSSTLTNSTPTPDVVVKYGASVSTPNEFVVLDVSNFTADAYETISNGARFRKGNRIAFVSHSGARQWFGLVPGVNRVTLTSKAASGQNGYALISFRAPYL